jgi:hypothetical protein
LDCLSQLLITFSAQNILYGFNLFQICFFVVDEVIYRNLKKIGVDFKKIGVDL